MAEHASTYTTTTCRILLDWFERIDEHLAVRERQEIEQNEINSEDALQEYEGVRIDPYIPYLTAPNSWLPILEDRIRRSVVPVEYEGEPSTEWLSEEAARSAIAFFRIGADLLPAEPHIYAAKSGDLVAEFETEKGNLTSVVSDNDTVLFAVLASDPYKPIQCVIRRGSNQFRDELRSFTRSINLGSHGQMDPAE